MAINNNTAKNICTDPSADAGQQSSRPGCATGSTATAQAAETPGTTTEAETATPVPQAPDFAAIAHAAGRRAAVEWRSDLVDTPIAEFKRAAWHRFEQSGVTVHASGANFNAGFDSVVEQFSTRAPKGGLGQAPRNLDVIDILTARHNQVLGILSCIQADLADGPTLTRDTLSNTLWAAQTLLEQAQEAARQL